jgi:transposase
LELPAARHPGPRTQRAQNLPLAQGALAGIKKKALAEKRILVFIDESGLSQKPHRVRTWSPRGETPVLQYNFNWKSLSVIAGLTIWNFYFRLYPGSIKGPQVIEFLEHLQRHIGGKVLVIWDGAPIHRCRLVRDYLDGLNGKIWVEPLPAYAPELNPAEYIWGYFKQHQLPNLCARDLAQLSHFGRKALGRMRRRPKLITAFWKQAELW